jgi:hypothetical protein
MRVYLSIFLLTFGQGSAPCLLYKEIALRLPTHLRLTRESPPPNPIENSDLAVTRPQPSIQLPLPSGLMSSRRQTSNPKRGIAFSSGRGYLVSRGKVQAERSSRTDNISTGAYVPRCSSLGSIIVIGLTGDNAFLLSPKNHEITDIPSASACFRCPVADYLAYYQVLVHTIREI